jgi:ubiquinone/menaquinone biosynthesis C-methylase UbiE
MSSIPEDIIPGSPAHTQGENGKFEDLYIALNDAEHRIYGDDEVMLLPEVEPGNRYKNEWKVRKASCNRMISYLRKKKRPLRILEVGCGNGWLSHQLAARLKESMVTGLDINLPELDQAARVFAFEENLRFIHGDLRINPLANEKFDIIIFAASLQYFRSLAQIISAAFGCLSEGGEIHVLDTHFYSADGAREARMKAENYFRSAGFEEMKQFYFQHTVDDIKEFNHRILFNPGTTINKWLKRGPFFWVLIKPGKK